MSNFTSFNTHSSNNQAFSKEKNKKYQHSEFGSKSGSSSEAGAEFGYPRVSELLNNNEATLNINFKSNLPRSQSCFPLSRILSCTKNRSPTTIFGIFNALTTSIHTEQPMEHSAYHGRDYSSLVFSRSAAELSPKLDHQRKTVALGRKGGHR